MQVSKKEILEQIERHVMAYQRTYLSVGDAVHEYFRASAYVHSLKLLFSGSKSICAACDAAAERLSNIFLNGDVEDYYCLENTQTTAKQTADSIEPIAAVHIQGNDFEEVLTESDLIGVSTPLGHGTLPELIDKIAFKTVLPCESSSDLRLKGLMIRNILSRSVRQKPRCAVRLPVDRDWTGAYRYCFDRVYRSLA